MNSLRHFSLLAVVAMLIVGLAACGEDVATPVDDTTGTDDYSAIDLESPTGGLTPTDEAVGFGDPVLLAAVALEDAEVYDDPVLEDTEVASMVEEADTNADGDRPMRRSYFLRMLWGNLEGVIDDETGEVVDLARVDWSGALQIDRGVVVVRRVLRFERGIDHLLPRDSRQAIAWESYTGGHFDGLLVQIVEPLGNPEGSLAPELENRVRLKIGEFSADFATSEIPGLDRTAEVGDAGAVHLLGFENNGRMGCPRGFLAGIWAKGPDGNGGAFRGRWVNRLGTTTGFMRGRWGTNEGGERVFVGKMISRRGRFEGFMRGNWEPNEDRPGTGQFRGGWAGEGGHRKGALGGRYRHAGDRPGGFYHGRWTAACDLDAEAMFDR